MYLENLSDLVCVERGDAKVPEMQCPIFWCTGRPYLPALCSSATCGASLSSKLLEALQVWPNLQKDTSLSQYLGGIQN